MYLKAIIEYDGTNYFGWQIQPDKPTVEKEIRRVLKRLFSKEINIKYASRTDRGVHARGQIITFEAPLDIHTIKIQKALNSYLAEDIRIKEITACDLKFKPRYDIKSKLYIYSILTASINDCFLRNFSWHIPEKLDWKIIRRCAKIITGMHDFKLFSSCDNKEKNTNIYIEQCFIKKTGNIYKIHFQARNFLTYMIRFLVGFMIEAGKGRETEERLEMLLKGKGKKNNYCAPARGLLLMACFS